MGTFSNPLRSEARALRVRLGLVRPAGARIFLIHVALVAVFGGLLPWSKGLEFLDPVMISAYSCLGVLFAAPAAAQAFSEDRTGRGDVSMATALARILMAVLYGECVALAILFAGVVTVNASHWFGRPYLPELGTLASAGALGVSASFALSATGAWITARFSAAAARGALRVIFLALLCLFFFRSRWLPDVAGTAAVVSVILSAVMLVVLRRQLERSR